VGFALLLVNGTRALGQPTAQGDSALFLRGVQGVDSWRPMNRPTRSRRLPTRRLYERLFFEAGSPAHRLRAAALPRPRRDPARARVASALNVLSWLCVALTIAASAWLPSAHSGARAAGVRLTAPPPRAGNALRVGFYPLVKAYTLGQMQVCERLLRAVPRRLVARLRAAARAGGGDSCREPQYGLFVLWAGAPRWRFAAAALGTGVVPLGRRRALLRLRRSSTICASSRTWVATARPTGRTSRRTALLQRLFRRRQRRLGPRRLSAVPSGRLLGTLLSSLALLAAGLPGCRARVRADAPTSRASAALTLASPLAWEHHYGVLLPILPIAFGALLERGARRGDAWWLAACAVVASLYLHALGSLSGTVWNPLQSLLLFASLALLALLLSWRRVQ
jgi:hypothetical protein